MSFFGARRSRQTRVFRPSQSVWEKLRISLQDYQVLAKFLLALLAVAMLLIAMQAWSPPFSHRVGHYVSDGVISRVPFEVENPVETQRAISEQMDASPLVFVQQNDVLDRLSSRFRDHLSEIANVELINNVPESVSLAFGWQEADAEIRSAQFNEIRNQLNAGEPGVGERIDQLVLEVSRLLGAARFVGILESSALDSIDIIDQQTSREQPIEIVDDSGQPLQFGILADVILEDQLRDTGRLGKEWGGLTVLTPLRPIVEEWLSRNVSGHLIYDAAETESRRSQIAELVEVKYDSFPAGAVLVPAGTQVTADQLKLLELEFQTHNAEAGVTSALLRTLSVTVMLSVLVLFIGIYLKRSEQTLLNDTSQLLTFILVCVGAVFLSGLLSRDPWRAEVLPLLAAVMVIAIIHNQVLAILTAVCLSLLVSTSTVGGLGHFVILVTTTVASVVPLRRVSSRSALIKVGFLVAITAFVSVWSVSVIESHTLSDGWRNLNLVLEAAKFAGWALVCCYLVAGSLPFIESASGIVTDMSLLELSNVSHPLLQELSRRAPGTYNHSMTVATIGEAAADAIGANGLLVRVGAYFHDIGKMVKPEYFIENMVEGQESAHTNLSPAMSALIIIGHVKDGAEMAEQHNLPQKLIDFIEQHHGTTLVEYFYHEATIRADEDHRTDADESTFRYPGPRPQSREAGVMMLSDAVESASRSLSEPTPKRIQSLVKEITLKRLLDGQFDECGLRMSELTVVQESLVKTLLAVHHGRIKYPDQKSA